MLWHIVLVILIAGQQIELKDTRAFDSLPNCNAEIARLSQSIRVSQPWVLTCASEVRA